MPTDKFVNKKTSSPEKSSPAEETTAPRQRRSPEAARDNILAAAEAILTATGPQNLKLTEVAREAAVSPAAVLHHFGSIDGVQTALMERMVTQLVQRVVAITAAAAPDQALGPDADVALFDAFEAQGAARLAAWLVMTGQATQFTVVRRAVGEVVDVILARLPAPRPPRDVLEDLILASITIALGAGLFGQPLSVLLGRDAGHARVVTLQALAARAAQLGLG